MDGEPLRHAIQAEAILIIFALVAVVELFDWALKRFLLQIPPSKEELELSAKVKKIERDAHKYDLPNTFMTWAKMKREAAKLEKEVLKMEESRRKKDFEPWRQQLKKVMSYRNTALFIALFFFYESTLVKAPLLEFPSGWMFPFARVVALPNYSSGAVSVVGWSFLCQRFFGRFL